MTDRSRAYLLRRYSRHPAALMWRGRAAALAEYALCACREWSGRGYVDNLAPRLEEAMPLLEPTGSPDWLGDDRFHSSHRSNLLRKDPLYYGRFGWSEPPDLPYFWPEGLAPP